MIKKPERPGFDRRMTKDEINACPLLKYNGSVHLIRTRQDLTAAAKKLQKQTVLGFDTETRPSYKKGQIHLPTIIQLAAAEDVYIFQLRQLKFPLPLREILANPEITKSGVALDFDLKQLTKLGPFKPAGFFDLATAAGIAGIKNHGLRGLAAVLLGFRISKQARQSDWSRKELTAAQIKYAATDAWISRELYFNLLQKLGSGA